ncbi:hypothetical protein MOX02_40950 [Methylobacterium oxalidis]|uniref:Uncharacterized protein n=1 Tax=Methylobacterium oxalidis TaxID=944322 RepID=A0A512J7W2_9HYPH|nr:hypothetical protein MOX02_40950 [Methylobacterium oxalidis]GLS64297.1 hypothetical protein GCM10007888_26780 [Methylobacterium oxalidis]
MVGSAVAITVESVFSMNRAVATTRGTIREARIGREMVEVRSRLRRAGSARDEIGGPDVCCWFVSRGPQGRP